ncbi:hypothetical protein BDC45DRAFT_541482 [Circinella umbellata]|nr:hypothetical protein BDC45DRAFT_541482 [Circinella umbellata]
MHQYDLPIKQYENNIVDKHLDIESPFQATNPPTSPTSIMKSDSESDSTTIIDYSDDEDINNDSILSNQKDDNSISETNTSSDITLSQEDDIPGTSVPNTPITSLSSSTHSSKISTATIEGDNNQLLSELYLSSKIDEQVIHLHIDVSKPTTPTVKLHNFKSRFKQALGLSPNHKKHRRTRRHCVDFEQQYPAHLTEQFIEKEREKDNENRIDNNKNNQYTERYQESMDLPAPTWHLKQYHPASPVPTLSYSICGPGSYQHHLQQGINQLQNRQKKLPQLPVIPPSTFSTALPTPTKMPVKGILKKRSKFPLPEEQDQQCNIDSTSSSLELSSSVIVTEKREQHHLAVEENNKSTTCNSVFKPRSWLHKLKNTMISSNSSPSAQQQQTNNDNNKDKNGETEQERKQGKRAIRYNKMVIVHETYTPQEYNREPDPNISCTFLTAEEAQDIKNELNINGLSMRIRWTKEYRSVDGVRQHF